MILATPAQKGAILVLCLLTLMNMTKINLEAIARIESSGNAKAFNWKTKATGLFQITPICLKDWNACHPAGPVYKESDLWDAKVNREIADWYLHERIPQMLRFYGIPQNTENVLIAFNWGIGNLKEHRESARPLPQETANYLTRYNRELIRGR